MPKNQIRKALPMVLLVIPFLYLILVDPFAEPVQTILEALFLAVIIGITIADSIKSWREADEVQQAGARFSVSVGAASGLACAFAFVIVLRNVPGVGEFIAGIAAFASNGLPPAAVGFALGALTTLVLVVVGFYVAYAVWAWRMARQ